MITLDWSWYQDIPCKVLYLHFFLLSQENEQIITSRGQLAKETNLSVQQVRTALEKLQSSKDIEIKSNLKNTIVNLISKSPNKNKKKNVETALYGEFQNVELSSDEYLKLETLYVTKERLEQAIGILSSYMQSKNKSYKCCYAVLGKSNWVYSKINKENPINESQSGRYNAYA